MCGLLVAIVLLMALPVVSVLWMKRGIQRDVAKIEADLAEEFRLWSQEKQREQAEWYRDRVIDAGGRGS